jgi:hypothetical protein
MNTLTTGTSGDAVMPAFVKALGIFHEVRTQLMAMASAHPETVLLYLKSVPQNFNELPGGDLLRDLEAVASGTLDDATSESAGSARH